MRLGEARQGKVILLKEGMMEVKKEFKAAKWAGFSDKKAQKYGECLDMLQDKHGVIEPRMVLTEAKKKSSPLHDYFEWDNTRAANKYRLHQARALVNHIEITIVYDDGKEGTVRRFHNISVVEQGEKRQCYVNIKTVADNEDYIEQIVERAFREANAWRERYKHYEKLTPICRAIETFKRKK